MAHFSGSLFHTFLKPYDLAQQAEAADRAEVLQQFPEEVLEQISKIARLITGASIGSVNIVEPTAVKVLHHTGQLKNSYPHEESFCGFAVLEPDIITVVEDASLDRRFSKHAIVTGNEHIRFYAGAHVLAPGGMPVATICAYDTVPRQLSDEQKESLAFIARAISQRLDLVVSKKALEAEKKKFQTFMDSSPMIAFIKDPEGRYTYTNQPFLKNFQVEESEILGQSDLDLWPEVGEQLAAHDRWIMKQNEMVKIVEEGPADADGKPTWWQSYKFPIPGSLPSLGGVAINITEMYLAHEQVRNVAGVNLLTGLPNRQTLLRELPRLFERATKSHLQFGLLHLDIDRFKAFTDTHGEDAGDAMVRRLAQSIRDCVRATDRCYHLRCDEFMVLIEELDTVDDLRSRCQEILAKASQVLLLPRQTGDISISIGCVRFDGQDADYQALLTRADIARKNAKRKGGGCYSEE